MTQDEIQIIIDSELSSSLKSALIKNLLDKKNEDVQICKEGNVLYAKGGAVLPDWFVDYMTKFEGFKDTAYNDNGAWAVGYGLHSINGVPVTEKTKITEPEARAELIRQLTDSYNKLSTVFSNIDKAPLQFKLALLDHSYRGGIGNFSSKSPKMKAAIDSALTDGHLSSKEIAAIVKEMENKLNTNSNLDDRKQRRASMFYNLYNPKDNTSIGYATSYHTPYYNFSAEILNPKSSWYVKLPKDNMISMNELVPEEMNDFVSEPTAVYAKEGTKLESIHPTTDINIANKTYHVAVAKTEEEKEIGLSKINSISDDEGMLFVYEEPQEDLWFTMADTSVDLDIIFIDEEGYVTSVNHCKAHMLDPIPDLAGNAQYVLEVKINSGIRSGDEIEEYNDEDEDLTKEEKEEAVKRSKMLVLDENGNVLMKLEGGERIFSRISTRKFIKAAIRAYKSDKDSDYRKVGKLVFEELNAQDGRKPEYVSAPK